MSHAETWYLGSWQAVAHLKERPRVGMPPAITQIEIEISLA